MILLAEAKLKNAIRGWREQFDVREAISFAFVMPSSIGGGLGQIRKASSFGWGPF